MQMNCWLKSGSTGKIVYAIQNYVRNKGDETYAIYGLGENQPIRMSLELHLD